MTVHNVGQGLFCSGEIRVFDCSQNHKFVYVYDCGSSSSAHYLSKAIHRFSHKITEIDLLIISHFDEDHINGVSRLLGKCKVKRVLLPDISLEERLVLAFRSKVGISNKNYEFYLDPAKFILTKFTVGEVLIVPPASGQTSDIDKKDFDIRDNPIVYDEDSTFKSTNPRIKKLKPGSKLTVFNCFEFIPYNDNFVIKNRIQRKFRQAIDKERKNLIGARTSTDIEHSLLKLSEKYNQAFKSGNNGYRKNVISLFMFIAPINFDINITCLISPYLFKKISVNKNAFLFTGDAYLCSKRRLKKLKDFITTAKFLNISCFQIMHHGADGSSFKGLAKEINPLISVCSSDPYGSYKHPHKSVLTDFKPYNFCQADSKNYVLASVTSYR